MLKYFAAAIIILASSLAFAQDETPAIVVETDYSSPLSILSGETQHAFSVEIADDQEEIATGMMHRPDMAADVGMLFDLGETRIPNFYMRNTLVSLDLLFLSGTGEIMAIAHNAAPLSERNISPGVPVSFVLEIKGGQSSILGIKPGDTVQHELLGNNG